MRRFPSSRLVVMGLALVAIAAGCDRRPPPRPEGALRQDTGPSATDGGADDGAVTPRDAASVGDGGGDGTSPDAAGATAARRPWSLRWLRPDVEAPPRLNSPHPQIRQAVKVRGRSVTVEITLAARMGEAVPSCRRLEPCVFTMWVRLGGRRLEAYRFRSAADIENIALCGVTPVGRRLVAHCWWTDGAENDLGAVVLDPAAGRLEGEPVVARVVWRPGRQRIDDEVPDQVRPVPVWRDGRIEVAATAPRNSTAWLWDPRGGEVEQVQRCGSSAEGECAALPLERYAEDLPSLLVWREMCGEGGAACLAPAEP